MPNAKGREAGDRPSNLSVFLIGFVMQSVTQVTANCDVLSNGCSRRVAPARRSRRMKALVFDAYGTLFDVHSVRGL